MNVLEANIRNSKSKGDLRSLRNNGNVPAIIYGGSNKNEKISVSKKILKIKISFVLPLMLEELKGQELLESY